MTAAFNKYVLWLVAISLLLIGIYYFISYSFLNKTYFQNFWIIVTLFFSISLIYHYGLLKSLKRGDKEMIRYFMLASSLKLFFLLIVVAGYVLLIKTNIKFFVVHFFLCYLIFTSFEVAQSYRLMRKDVIS